MADDIIPLRHSYVRTMVERITELEAEIERLRAREQDLRMHAEQDACEIERLRAETRGLHLDLMVAHGEASGMYAEGAP